MRYRYSFGFALLGLMIQRPMLAIAQTIPLQFPLQTAESSIDSTGCLRLAATAVVDAPIEDVFDGLCHPEELYGGHPSVFVMVPPTKESSLHDTWTVASPFAEIIEFDGPPGLFWGPGGPPFSWVKYTFVRDTHTILIRTIGSTVERPRRDGMLVLSRMRGGSATFIRYSSSECWHTAYSGLSSSAKLGDGEAEKLSLTKWLKFADAAARRIAKDHSKGPIAAPGATRSNPSAAPFPKFLGSTP
jgi:hypothetical protein